MRARHLEAWPTTEQVRSKSGLGPTGQGKGADSVPLNRSICPSLTEEDAVEFCVTSTRSAKT
eukprot:1159994-Pelagomonas_calceolata.AAC.2